MNLRRYPTLKSIENIKVTNKGKHYEFKLHHNNEILTYSTEGDAFIASTNFRDWLIEIFYKNKMIAYKYIEKFIEINYYAVR